MLKPDLRKHFLNRRKLTDDSVIEKQSLDVRDRFAEEFGKLEFETVHCFLPILKHKEINTWPLIDFFSEKTVVVSKSDFKTHEMHSFVLEKNTPLEENRWGIPEPVNARPIHEHKIDLVLIPLLTFDKLGYRVGYGKGFYDRFLQRCRPDVLKVGLSLEAPVEKISDTHEHDQKLDYCITPDKVWSFV
ncbi:5-formyltetrahydrofolate cyclo-ligase [Fulvitalea axinellae]|uniref:5-formyltetrahydrofolate cyclo-ligase n=1 Tax=Fulvitalea axinellae TaxID=1182444 RepID=A0AAU9C9K0_9BACT|nr:5-formyltetrahydrofolate cyclo-ligase [Fulvitalea axinellae]